MSASFTRDEVLQATGGEPKGGVPYGFDAVSTDTRTLTPGALFVALKGDSFDAHQLLDAAARARAGAAVVRRGAPNNAPASLPLVEVDDTLVALGQLARLHRRRFSIPVGAITGSNGKTTTKEMIGAILAARGPALKTEGNLNNEIGVPLTLMRLEAAHTAAIIEMGMNHPGELMRLSSYAEPAAALITSVAAAHLEGLGTIEAVARAKGEIFSGLGADGLAIANADDPLALEQARLSGRRVCTFGRADGADVRLAEVISHDADGLRVRIEFWPNATGPSATAPRSGASAQGERSGTSAQGRPSTTAAQGAASAQGERSTASAQGERTLLLKFVGLHNAVNATAAFAMGLALGCTPDQCVAGLEAARPWAHRLALVPGTGSATGITVIDDCYNANPASMTAALQTLAALAAPHARRRVAVLGDMLELGAAEESLHRSIGEAAADNGVALLVAFGPRSRAVCEAARARGIEAFHVADPTRPDEALGLLAPRLAPGDVVLVKGSRGMRLERVVEALTGVAAGGGHH